MSNNHYYDVIQKSLDFIEENPGVNLDLENLSGQANMSKFFFHRLFSAVMGVPVRQYIQARRINRAISLIQGGHRPLADIAYDLGFSDQASFNRTFKRQTAMSPGDLKKNPRALETIPVPHIVRREFKNLNGEVITDFSLDVFQPFQIRGVAFEVDLADPGFKTLIRSRADELHGELGREPVERSFMIYSNCEPGSSKFKALYGVEKHFETVLPNVFTVTVPVMHCASFAYRGDLLEISDVFTSDFSRFLKISRLDATDSEIELLQVFRGRDMENYDIRVPIAQ